MTNPVEAFGPQLSQLQAAAEAALTSERPRMLAYAVVDPTTVTAHLLEMRGSDHVYPEEFVAEQDSDFDPAEQIGLLHDRWLQRFVDDIPGNFSAIQEHYGISDPGLMHVVGRATGRIATRTTAGGLLEVFEFYDGHGQPLATVTSILRDEEDVGEAAVLLSQGDEVHQASFRAAMVEELFLYEASLAMFGEDPDTLRLFLGRFDLGGGLESALESLRQTALLAEEYDPKLIQLVVDGLREMVLTNAGENYTTSPGQLERFGKLVTSLAGE